MEEPPVVSEGEKIRKEFTGKEAFGVLYKSKELLVVDKPPDLRIDGNHDATVEKWVAKEHEELLKGEGRKLRFCHQLDYATSGVLCLAFTKHMAARVSHCFQSRTSKKLYLAIVHGHPDMEELHRFDQPIADDPTDPNGFRMCVGTTANTLKRKLESTDGKEQPPQGRAALTYCKVLQHGVLSTCSDTPVSLVVLAPCTGRRHQLRVHCQQWGHPIAGDICYHPADKQRIVPRMMLHAWRLCLPIDCEDTANATRQQLSKQKAARRSQKVKHERSVKIDEEKQNEEKAQQALAYLTTSTVAELAQDAAHSITEGAFEVRTGNRLGQFIVTP